MSGTPKERAPGAAGALCRDAVRSLAAGRFAEGVELLQGAERLAPRDAEIQGLLAAALVRAGDVEAAQAHYARACELAPENPAILNACAAFLLNQNRPADARPLLERARLASPDHPEILASLGLLGYKTGDLKGAEELLLRALKGNPSMPHAHATLGHVLRAGGRASLAEKAYQYALKLDPGSPVAVDLANLMFESFGREADAVTLMQGCAARNPGHARAQIRLLEMLEEANRIDEAQKQLLAARRLQLSGTRIAVVEAKLLRRDGKAAEAAALLESQEGEKNENDEEKAARYFELGRLYDSFGEADKAFDAFSRAKRLRAEQGDAPTIDRAASRRFISRVRASLKAPAAGRAGLAPPMKSPLFLVGFPRSGTTLLDQILSSHPGVTVSEERPAISILLEKAAMRPPAPGVPPAGLASESLDYPACLRSLTEADLEAMRQFYFDAHGRDAAGPGVFIDKMPLNLLHADFIRLLFPEAKFVVALRHPCDAVLSFFMQDFAHSAFMVRSLDLQDAAHFYDEAFGLWEEFRATLRLDAATVRYEDVVADFRPTVESLLSFLGLPWNDAVLEFDKTAKSRERIRTPSYHQVTQKIYTRAAGRWQRYRKYMEPVLPVLAPHAARYGYSMEPPGAPQEPEKTG